MFVGVVVENFHRCRAELEKEERAARAVKRARKIEERRKRKEGNLLNWKNENKKMSPGMLEPPRYLDYSPVRLVLYRLVTSKYFDLAISAVIGLNIITMAMEFYMMPQVGKLREGNCHL